MAGSIHRKASSRDLGTRHCIQSIFALSQIRVKFIETESARSGANRSSSFDQNESFDLLMDFKCSDHVVDPLRTRRAILLRENHATERERAVNGY